METVLQLNSQWKPVNGSYSMYSAMGVCVCVCVPARSGVVAGPETQAPDCRTEVSWGPKSWEKEPLHWCCHVWLSGQCFKIFLWLVLLMVCLKFRFLFKQKITTVGSVSVCIASVTAYSNMMWQESPKLAELGAGAKGAGMLKKDRVSRPPAGGIFQTG